MPRASQAVRDAVTAFCLSRAVVLLAVLVSSRAHAKFATDWDAGFYQNLARLGYRLGSDPAQIASLNNAGPAFFPLLPFMERVLHDAAGMSYDHAGLLLSNAGTLLGLFALHRVTAARLGGVVARLAVFAVAFFPFSYVFSNGYTEGPFLLASVGTYWATLRRREATALAAGFGAGLLRPTGVLLAPALALDAWLHPERRRAALAGAAGCVAGPLVYFLYLWHARGDFFASLHAQQTGWQRSVGLTHAVPELARELGSAIATPHLTDLVYWTAVPLCVAGLVILWRRGIRDGAFAFALLGLLGPLSTGSAMSLPRFAMATFPYAWAAGLGLERLPGERRTQALAVSAVALVLGVAASYWRANGLAP